MGMGTNRREKSKSAGSHAFSFRRSAKSKRNHSFIQTMLRRARHTTGAAALVAMLFTSVSSCRLCQISSARSVVAPGEGGFGRPAPARPPLMHRLPRRAPPS